MTARAGGRCPDIDGLPRVRVVEHAYCEDCGRPVIWTRTGWHHDPMFEEIA